VVQSPFLSCSGWSGEERCSVQKAISRCNGERICSEDLTIDAYDHVECGLQRPKNELRADFAKVAM